MKEICMPKYGATMESGEVTKWLVKVGDVINKGDPIAEISSEKLVNTLESLESGKVEELLLEEGDEAKVGDPIMRLS
jgi:Pyruvate/2-oxoglutarate dehydrogenase complex, dihydrolipoamide acyltransferase (E2) component, and related enzymes